MAHFILRQEFKGWSDNCDLPFEFKKPRIPNNLIKQNLRAYRRAKYCHNYFVSREDIDILVLFTDTMKAKRRICTFENSTKIFIKNGLFG
jgi:hypothetical protein